MGAGLYERFNGKVKKAYNYLKSLNPDLEQWSKIVYRIEDELKYNRKRYTARQLNFYSSLAEMIITKNIETGPAVCPENFESKTKGQKSSYESRGATQKRSYPERQGRKKIETQESSHKFIKKLFSAQNFKYAIILKEILDRKY